MKGFPVVLQIKQSQSLTRKWAEDHEVTHCLGCGKGFSVTIRRVGTASHRAMCRTMRRSMMYQCLCIP